MELHIDMELQGELLLVTLSGDLAYDPALPLLKQMCDTAKEKGVSKILVHALAVQGELSTLERYTLGTELGKYIMQRQMNPRLAAIGKPPSLDGFAALVAQNRSLTAKVFSSQQEALTWLANWPS
jgi:hypothetical protein